ncbi:hypothetical protein PCE1_002447 [Barthelona sp. PCE]
MSTSCSFVKFPNSLIGSGAYGNVYRGYRVDKNMQRIGTQIYALKEISFKNTDDGVPSPCLREISVLKDLQHENVVCLHTVMTKPDGITLVFDYCTSDLKNYLHNNDLLSLEDVLSLTHQMLCGVGEIHRLEIVHRDLKPENLLLKDNTLKVADFGLAYQLGINRFKDIQKDTSEICTLWYRDPRLFLGKIRHDTGIDLWSIGCIIFEFTTGRPLFKAKTPEDMLKVIFTLFGIPQEEELVDMFDVYPKQRKSVLQTLTNYSNAFGLSVLTEEERYDNLASQISSHRPDFTTEDVSIIADMVFAFCKYSNADRGSASFMISKIDELAGTVVEEEDFSYIDRKQVSYFESSSMLLVE